MAHGNKKHKEIEKGSRNTVRNWNWFSQSLHRVMGSHCLRRGAWAYAIENVIHTQKINQHTQSFNKAHHIVHHDKLSPQGGKALSSAMPWQRHQGLSYHSIPSASASILSSLLLIPTEPASTPSFTHCTVIYGACICLKWFSDEKVDGVLRVLVTEWQTELICMCSGWVILRCCINLIIKLFFLSLTA